MGAGGSGTAAPDSCSRRAGEEGSGESVHGGACPGDYHSDLLRPAAAGEGSSRGESNLRGPGILSNTPDAEIPVRILQGLRRKPVTPSLERVRGRMSPHHGRERRAGLGRRWHPLALRALPACRGAVEGGGDASSPSPPSGSLERRREAAGGDRQGAGERACAPSGRRAHGEPDGKTRSMVIDTL